MNAITRYVLRQLVIGMVLVTAGLTIAIWLTQSLRFVELIVNRGLSAAMFVYLTALLLPNFLSVILPVALFAVVLFVYSKMVADREIVVMRAVGMGPFGLARPALAMAAGVAAVACAINFWLLPESYRLFRELQWDIRYNYTNVLLREGTFNAVSKGVTVYVRERSADGQLHGLLIHDGRDPEKPMTIMAARGAMVDTNGQAHVVMLEGNRQEVDRTSGKLSVLYFDRYTFDLQPDRAGTEERYREARERPMGELLTLRPEAVPNPNDYGKFRVELHKRLIAPVFVLGYALIAVAAMTAGTVLGRNQYRRTGFAVAVFLVVQSAALGLENATAKQVALWPLMYANALLPVIGGALLLGYHPRRPRAALLGQRA